MQHVPLNDAVILRELCRLARGEPSEIPLDILLAYVHAVLTNSTAAEPQDDFLERLYSLPDLRPEADHA